ncbi:hypothetical protein [Pseudomonas sp. NA-150]|uniref:hypothetical protein n=1 Tax=Pseudomonas sp. NA-150 TaxID=3367525 RepID=UPI0037CAAE5C
MTDAISQLRCIGPEIGIYGSTQHPSDGAGREVLRLAFRSLPINKTAGNVKKMLINCIFFDVILAATQHCRIKKLHRALLPENRGVYIPIDRRAPAYTA